MRVLSFSSLSKKPTATKGRDWSQQEIADFYRAHRLLAENGAAIGIDRGLTDIGEPWIVFYDIMTQDVFLHVGRIDGECILICEALGIRLKAATISDLVLRFEATVREHISVRAERQSNVVLHPAARVIMAISAVFLLSKIDGSGVAHAGEAEAGDQPGSIEDAGKKADAAPLARAQTALARLFDTVDSPRAVASLAGAILTGELLIHLQPATHQEEPVGEANGVAIEVAHLPQAPDAPLNEEKDASLEGSHLETGIEKVPSATQVLVASSGAAVEQMQATYQNDQASSEEKIVFFLPQVSGRSGDHFKDVVLASVAVPPMNTVESVPTAGTDKSTPEAIDVLQSILGRSLKGAEEGVVTIGSAHTDVTKGIATLAPVAGMEISLSTLDKLDETVGFYMQTSLSDTGLHSMLSHFLASMSGYEIEYVGGRVLIEQQNTDGLASNDIGLWTNVLQDGSTISVIGQVALIDDIGGLLV